MNKIKLIIWRELKSRLTNKTFIIMTVLAPILMAGFFAVMIKLMQSDDKEQNLLVLDESGLFKETFSGKDDVSITFSKQELSKAQAEFIDKGYTCLLWISPTILEGGAGAVKLVYQKSPGAGFQTWLKTSMEKVLYEYKLRSNNIDPDIIHNSKTSVKFIIQKVDDAGNVQDTGDLGFVGFMIGALMFVFVLLYGMMVFRSVMEEKTSRIVEVIVSSVRPFELMMGKIIGVALLGIIQFVIMGIITTVLISLVSLFLLKDANAKYQIFKDQQEYVKKHGTNIDLSQLEKFEEQREVFDMLKKFEKIDFVQVIICFVLFFIGGYLFYSSIMAAIGSAVDSEADSQQFITPVMLPLTLGYMIALKTVMDPDSSTVFWASLIPFTSPIVMMARVSSGTGVPIWQIVVSLVTLYATFFGTTLLAARIYRTGILMYGKKVNWKELGKWIFYR